MRDKELRGFEFLLIAQLVLNILLISDPNIAKELEWLAFLENTYLLSFGTFVVFFIGLIRIDGMRISTLFIVLSEIFISACSSFSPQDSLRTVFLTLSLIFTLLASAIFYFFPVIRRPKTTGRHNVGYETFALDKCEEIAVFYPTESKYSKQTDLKYFPNFSEYMELSATIFKHMPKIPSVPPVWVLKFFGHLLTTQYMGVISKAPLANRSKMPTFVYSHGIMAHGNLAATFCKELASKGSIVICTAHPDELCLQNIPERLSTEKFISTILAGASTKRKICLDKVINFAINRDNLAKIFKNSAYLIQQTPAGFGVAEKVILIGHSLGGMTVLEQGIGDNRVQAIIGLDPAMCIFDLPEFNSKLRAQADKPILILRSESFAEVHPYYRQIENVTAIVEANTKKANLIHAALLKNTQHCDYNDIAYFQPRELQLARQEIFSPDNVTENMMLLNKLVDLFVTEVIVSPGDKFNIENPLKKFKEFCEKLKVDYPLLPFKPK